MCEDKPLTPAWELLCYLSSVRKSPCVVQFMVLISSDADSFHCFILNLLVCQCPLMTVWHLLHHLSNLGHCSWREIERQALEGLHHSITPAVSGVFQNHTRNLHSTLLLSIRHDNTKRINNIPPFQLDWNIGTGEFKWKSYI